MKNKVDIAFGGPFKTSYTLGGVLGFQINLTIVAILTIVIITIVIITS